MTHQHQQHAEKIVAAFRDLLDENTRQLITASQFNTLALMIKTGLGEELAVAIERMEEVIRQMRTETEKPDLGI